MRGVTLEGDAMEEDAAEAEAAWSRARAALAAAVEAQRERSQRGDLDRKSLGCCPPPQLTPDWRAQAPLLDTRRPTPRRVAERGSGCGSGCRSLASIFSAAPLLPRGPAYLSSTSRFDGAEAELDELDVAVFSDSGADPHSQLVDLLWH